MNKTGKNYCKAVSMASIFSNEDFYKLNSAAWLCQTYLASLVELKYNHA